MGGASSNDGRVGKAGREEGPNHQVEGERGVSGVMGDCGRKVQRVREKSVNQKKT